VPQQFGFLFIAITTETYGSINCWL